MSLGNNRDYKTRARRATDNLRRHKTVMDILSAEGMDATNASRIAFDIVTTHKRRTAIFRGRVYFAGKEI